MPIFEFSCKKCGKEFEELVFGQDEAVPCPACGSTKTAKLMSCCRSKTGGGAPDRDEAKASAKPAPSRGGCGGCAGGSCASCG